MRRIPLLMSLLLACSTEEPAEPAPTFSGDSEEGEDFVAFDPDSKADSFNPPDGPLVFAAACEPGDTLTIAAVGDLLLHGRLQKQAFQREDGFISLWSGLKDLLQAADVTYANLEGPTAEGVNKSGRDVPDPGKVFDDVVYSSYPMFNYHPSLLDDLIESGVDVVSTANNHSLDRRNLGLDRTAEALEARGLPYTGTRARGSDTPWHTFTKQGGFTLAWLACTYGTNGIPDPDHLVLNCYSDRSTVLAEIKALAARDDVDAVIVTPHWGLEYHASPANKEVTLAHEMLDAGALAVIGSHPHVLQPWERYITADGRETFAIYSLGNFVSGQRHLPRRSTLLLYLGLTRTADGVKINGARYVPLHMTKFGDGSLTLEVIDRAGGNADSRELTVAMFGHYNLFPPSAPLVTNPQCDPDWTPPKAPHPHTGWIGGGCEAADVCGGVECLDNLPGGLCTQFCDRTCPDRAGRATTFCADLGFENGGVCVLQCAQDADCREGYACKQVARPSEPNTVRSACLPE